MTIDEKIRYGMVAVGGASVVLTALGLHVAPLHIGSVHISPFSNEVSGAGD
jgi:hypothetical protein